MLTGCLLADVFFVLFIVWCVAGILWLFFDSGGIVSQTKQNMKEYLWYRKNEPWRYGAFVDPDYEEKRLVMERRKRRRCKRLLK